MKQQIRTQGLCVMLFVLLSTDLVIRPFSQRAGVRAQVYVPAAFLAGLLVLALTYPLVRAMEQSPVRERLKACWTHSVWAAPFAFVFAFGAVQALMRGSIFLQYISDESAPKWISAALMLAIAWYAMRCGVETLLRVCGILFGLFCISVVLLLISNVQEMRFYHLALRPFSASEVFSAAFKGVSVSAQIPLFLWFSASGTRRAQKGYSAAILAAMVLAAVFSTISEMVLGTQAQMQNQTVYALSRLGSISVMQRLDAMHCAVWMMMEITKVCAFAVGLRSALQFFLPQWNTERLCAGALSLLVVMFLLCYGLQDLQRQWVETALSAAVLVLAAYQIQRQRRKANESNHGA